MSYIIKLNFSFWLAFSRASEEFSHCICFTNYKIGLYGYYYICVSGKQDFYIACLLQLMPPVISGVIIQFFICFFTPIRLRIVYIKKDNIKGLFKDSFDNFSASFITLGFTYFNPLLVKFFFGDSALGIYSLADKLVNVLRQFYSPIVQAFFSQICGFLQSKNIVKYQQTIKKVFCFYCFISISALLFN